MTASTKNGLPSETVIADLHPTALRGTFNGRESKRDTESSICTNTVQYLPATFSLRRTIKAELWRETGSYNYGLLGNGAPGTRRLSRLRVEKIAPKTPRSYAPEARLGEKATQRLFAFTQPIIAPEAAVNLLWLMLTIYLDCRAGVVQFARQTCAASLITLITFFRSFWAEQMLSQTFRFFVPTATSVKAQSTRWSLPTESENCFKNSQGTGCLSAAKIMAGPVVRTVTPGAPSRSAVNLSNQRRRCRALTTCTVIGQQWPSQSERGRALLSGRRGRMSTQPKGLCPRQARKSEQPPKHHGEKGLLFLNTED
jgi:hypothetical protein